MNQKFQGFERLVGTESLQKIQSKKFCVVGLGGVGSWAAEALVRSGVINLKLVDYDEICLSNFNRQLHATEENIGKSKAEVLKRRLLDINPQANIPIVEDFFSKDNAASILDDRNIVIDAIDSLSAKCDLVVESKERNIPCIVIGGAGGKTNPLQIKAADLSQTINDPLLQKLRKKLRRDYGFPRKKTKFGIPTIYSEELAFWPSDCEKPSGSIDCASGFGTATYTTGSFGFAASFLALQEAIKA